MIDLDYLTKMAANEQADPPAFLLLIATYRALITPRPIEEYHEDMGDVLWWKFPIEEPPYVGTPNDYGFPVEMKVGARAKNKPVRIVVNGWVGGWPGYHTHFTPIPRMSKAPT